MYVEKQDGTYAQLDLVVATKAGIVMVEVKDYSGWIFGGSAQLHRTRVLAYGKQKYRFYNPIRQNSSHIAALKKRLGQFEHLPFYSVIVFYGNCVLKKIDTIPPGTFLYHNLK